MSRLRIKYFFIALLCYSLPLFPSPSHFMIGPGLFDVDKDHSAALLQLEYRWEIDFRHIRPLMAFFVTTGGSLFLCGGAGVDIFLAKRVILTPSFAPGVYYQGHGKRLGFPINFRSALELSFTCDNSGRIGVQFNHISNAGLLWKNPGVNSLVLFYAIPFPTKMKRG